MDCACSFFSNIPDRITTKTNFALYVTAFNVLSDYNTKFKIHIHILIYTSVNTSVYTRVSPINPFNLVYNVNDLRRVQKIIIIIIIKITHYFDFTTPLTHNQRKMNLYNEWTIKIKSNI